jgi:hypothetical protein
VVAEDDPAVAVAVAAVAEAGTVTAVIAAAGAAETVAGSPSNNSNLQKKPGSFEAPRSYFLGCQGTCYGLCFS